MCDLCILHLLEYFEFCERDASVLTLIVVVTSSASVGEVLVGHLLCLGGLMEIVK